MDALGKVLSDFVSHKLYLMFGVANLVVILGLMLFSKSAKENSFFWFLISASLMMSGVSVIAFTISKSNFLTGIEIGFACLLIVTLILGSQFGSTVECVGTVADNTLKIGYPALLKEAKAVRVICEENTLKTRFVSFEKGAVLDAVLATDNPERFSIGSRVRFKAVLREGPGFPTWPGPGMPYLDTRAWNCWLIKE